MLPDYKRETMGKVGWKQQFAWSQYDIIFLNNEKNYVNWDKNAGLIYKGNWVTENIIYWRKGAH